MQLVKFLTRLLDKSVKAKIERAEKRNRASQQAFQKAKGEMVRSKQEMDMAHAETLIQLKKLNDTTELIVRSKSLADKRMKAIDRVIETDA
jgi:hypothetical protein